MTSTEAERRKTPLKRGDQPSCGYGLARGEWMCGVSQGAGGGKYERAPEGKGSQRKAKTVARALGIEMALKVERRHVGSEGVVPYESQGDKRTAVMAGVQAKVGQVGVDPKMPSGEPLSKAWGA
jgi:hypothetical protein